MNTALNTVPLGTKLNPKLGDNMSDNFIMIPEYAGKILKLKHDYLIVYGIIYGFSKNEKGKYFGSLKYIQDITGCSKEHICRILKRLTEKGYIRKNAINARRIEYTVVPLNELKLDGKNADKPSNLPTDCETISRVSNHITEENKSICDEMDAINDKPPNQPTEYGNKMLAKISASVKKQNEND